MDGQLTIRVKTGPAHVLVTLAGNCDHSTGLEFRDGLATEVARGAQRLIVDLSELTWVDTAGLAALMSVRAMLEEDQGELRLVCPEGRVERLLRDSGLAQALPVYPSLEAALAAPRTTVANRMGGAVP